jgi:hypothetical protein
LKSRLEKLAIKTWEIIPDRLQEIGMTSGKFQRNGFYLALEFSAWHIVRDALAILTQRIKKLLS